MIKKTSHNLLSNEDMTFGTLGLLVFDLFDLPLLCLGPRFLLKEYMQGWPLFIHIEQGFSPSHFVFALVQASQALRNKDTVLMVAFLPCEKTQGL
mmetsp:Transcript_4390/g.5414  ORF Transcript_4390/g.5414 Transcript_4390/m.5414 type:complete len:95 (-) Transcript_4390:108-392(-)